MNTFDQIKADALDQDELVRLAFIDAADALRRFTVSGRPRAEAIRALVSWRVALENANSRRTYEKARRS
jgi:hypothetical protein